MRPDSEWVPSPNFKEVKGRKITCVVLHATATSGISSPREWLTTRESKVSAHYLIGKDGQILQLVSEKNVAWHAGESFWNGKPHVNNFSIGIEMVNPNDGFYPFHEEQIQACLNLCVPICKDYDIAVENVVGHCDIALGRKTDPAGFPFGDFRTRLVSAGVRTSGIV